MTPCPGCPFAGCHGCEYQGGEGVNPVVKRDIPGVGDYPRRTNDAPGAVLGRSGSTEASDPYEEGLVSNGIGVGRRPLPISQELADRLAIRLVHKYHQVREPGRNYCWVRVKPTSKGYTYVSALIDGKRHSLLAHRVLYVHYYGPIPDGLEIDHLCNNPGCINPKHLKAVPHIENVLRSKTNPFAIHARKTHCSQGHPLPERTTKKTALRKCQECRKQRRQRRRS